ncbi:MAG: hypothetical protein GXY58_11280 [Planctomycetaceae bacterium]|nr:hypothetical protein [Planctomycetaceae bacterium]
MSTSSASQQRLRRMFEEGFSVADIAEPLASFDAATPADHALAVMIRRNYRVAGVRHEGVIRGYVRQEDLDTGNCGDALHEFLEGDIVPDSAGFPQLIAALKDRSQLFVDVLGQVGGIVTRTDLEKPSVRMWLFGMITIIEMGLTRLIEMAYPDDSWQHHLSQGRLDKAQMLFEERRRREQDVDLLDCLQFSDRGRIVLRDEALRTRAGFVSRSRGEQTVTQLESLRNNLAHSQDIVGSNWDTIVKLTENLDKFVGRSP